jgi:hypothetical protein
MTGSFTGHICNRNQDFCSHIVHYQKLYLSILIEVWVSTRCNLVFVYDRFGRIYTSVPQVIYSLGSLNIPQIMTDTSQYYNQS